MFKKRLIIILLIVMPILGGCTAAVVGGAAVGGSMINDRRTTGVYLDDQQIEFGALQLKYEDDEIAEKTNISVISYNLTVLMVGQAENQQLVDRYAAKISQLARVSRIHNYVKIGAEGTWSDATSDAYLTTKAKLALFDVDKEGFNPGHIKVVTNMDTVYLMGIVTRAEAQQATDAVRFVSGVKHVVKVFEYID